MRRQEHPLDRLVIRLLFPRFSSVVVFTQHLAVRRCGLPALVPRLDVIAFHLFKRKLLLAFHADSLLPLVRFPLHVVGERADVQVSFIPIPKLEAAPNMALLRQLMEERKIGGLFNKDGSDYFNLIHTSFDHL